MQIRLATWISLAAVLTTTSAAHAQAAQSTVFEQLDSAVTGVVQIPPGTHVISDRIRIRGARDLIIEGNGATLLTPNGPVTRAPFLLLANCQRVTVRNLVMLDTDATMHNGAFEESHGVVVSDSEDVRLENLTIYDVGDEAVNFIRSRRSSIRHSTIRGAVLLSTARAGAITVTNSHEILIESNWIYDTRQFDAIRIETQNDGLATAVTIRGNQIRNSPVGIRINDFGGTVDGVIVANNMFQDVEETILVKGRTFNHVMHDNVTVGAATEDVRRAVGEVSSQPLVHDPGPSDHHEVLGREGVDRPAAR